MVKFLFLEELLKHFRDFSPALEATLVKAFFDGISAPTIDIEEV